MKDNSSKFYRVFINKDKSEAAKLWCLENLGERRSIVSNKTGRWTCFFNRNNEGQHNYRFIFENEKDAIWFELRWG